MVVALVARGLPNLPYGVLQLGNGGPNDWISGPITRDGGVVFDRSNALVFALGGKIHIFASGAGIFGTSGQFEYVYKNVTNDFDVSVRLESEGQSDPAANAGLMVRKINDSSGPGPADCMAMVASFPPDPSRNQNLFEYREDSYGTAVSPAAPRPGSTFLDNWFRHVRNGPMLSAYCSFNNAGWVFMGSVDSSTNAAGAYAANVWVGLAVSSQNATLVNEAIFSDFGTTKAPHGNQHWPVRRQPCPELASLQRRVHLAGDAQPDAADDMDKCAGRFRVGACPPGFFLYTYQG